LYGNLLGEQIRARSRERSVGAGSRSLQHSRPPNRTRFYCYADFGYGFSLVGEHSENIHFEPRETIAQGNKVVVLGNYHWRIKSTGKEYQSDFVHVCTFNDDSRITSFKEYLDTAAAGDAYTAA
jgi:hypothetical protein